MRTVHHSPITRSLALTVTLAALLLGTTACAAGDEVTPAQSSGSDTATDATSSAEEDADVDPTVCGDSEFTDAATTPDALADLEVPFYPCSLEMTAIADADPLFVGEYTTGHELGLVSEAISDQFAESDWTIIDSSMDGENLVSQAEKPGYSLVVVVGPTRAVETDTSIHYTLRSR